MDLYCRFYITTILLLFRLLHSKEILNGFTVSQIIPASKTTPKESAAGQDTAAGASVQTGIRDSIHTQTDITQTDIHDLYPAVSDHHFVLLELEGVISMSDCIKSDLYSEIFQCDWIVHVENNSVLTADIYIDIPEQPKDYDCGQCRLQYGYIFHHHTERVEVKRTCQHDTRFKYSVKNSLWLRFFCLGLGAHHELDWVLNGRELEGFNLTYSITELASPKPQKGWDLSTIFALTVMLLSLLAVGSIGFIVYRNCRSQSIQKNILQSRHHNISAGSKLNRLVRHDRSQHRHGPHQQFLKQHGGQKPRVSINEPLNREIPARSNSMVSTEYEEMSDDPGRPVALTELDEAASRPAVKPRRYHIRPTKSNHTYVSIIQQQRNSESNSDRERVDEVCPSRYPGRPVKSVSEHFLYADIDNSITPSPETEADVESPVRQPPKRRKPTQQCVMFRSKSHHSGMEPSKRKKKKTHPLAGSKHVGVASEYAAAMQDQGLDSNPSGLSLPCGIIDELHRDSSGASAASKHRQRVGLHLRRDGQKSASATSLNSEVSVVLRVTEPCYDTTSLQSGAVITEQNCAGEPLIDEERQTKLLTAPRYTSPKTAPIPHIILTRASIKHKHHPDYKPAAGCSPVEEVDSSRSNPEVSSCDDQRTRSMSCSEQSVHERSHSTASLPDDFSRTEARLLQNMNYASDESAVVPNSRRHKSVSASRDSIAQPKPRNLSKKFTQEAVLLYTNEHENNQSTEIGSNKEYASTDSGNQSRTADLIAESV